MNDKEKNQYFSFFVWNPNPRRLLRVKQQPKIHFISFGKNLWS